MSTAAPKWLSIIGIGDDGLAGLSPAARTLMETADVFIGGDRHLAMLGEDPRQRLAWPSPFLAIIDTIKSMRGRQVCVLATGDPMWFGIGVTLAKHLPVSEMTIVPAPSAFSLAAARLGWPLSEVVPLTVHGRPIALLSAHLTPGVKLLILANDADTSAQVAEILSNSGFGRSRLTALSHMGGETESVISALAAKWSQTPADFHTLAVELVADPGVAVHGRAPGLADDAFAHDGTMTKRDVRAATLARLAPMPGNLLIDVGAGCGSIAIEWMRTAPNTKAIAIESRKDRCALIAQNAVTLGVPQLDIRQDAIDQAIDDCPSADAVFLGGGLDTPKLIARALGKLKTGGRLVANAVTLQSEALLQSAWTDHGGELVRLAISHAEPLGGGHGWRPLRPVTQWSLIKT